MLRIALTGGIASGKTTVAQLFVTLGAKLIDTDQVARDVVTPGSPVLQQIVDRFGAQVLNSDHTLDRPRLRQLVFADANARADLEAIMHPAIRARVAQLSATLVGPYQLVAVPLLVETGTQRDYDRVLAVDCDPRMQLRRLMVRDGLGEADARRMLEAQASREARLAIADDVIRNDGDITTLAAQVQGLHTQYVSCNIGTCPNTHQQPSAPFPKPPLRR
ncbi:MAG: dephospho-CoA kinase [Pseudomonadota bacterium]